MPTFIAPKSIYRKKLKHIFVELIISSFHAEFEHIKTHPQSALYYLYTEFS